MRVMFVASEGVPFSKTGGLADVIGALPQALAQQGLEVSVLLPRYGMTESREMAEVSGSVTLPLCGEFHFARVLDGGTSDGVHFYLLDVPELFDRKSLYGDLREDYPDNHLRFAALSLSALEFPKRLGPPPDVIHCHDWQTALVPVYLRHRYRNDPYFSDTRTVLTVHNIGYQGICERHVLRDISLDDSLFTMEGLEYYGKVNLLKGGLVFADAITTVSSKYAEEIQTPEFGFGLDGVLKRRGQSLHGILNGVDYSIWNPAIDPLTPYHYTAEKLEGKKDCKRALLERMGLDNLDLDRPLVGIVSRFAAQKGFDILHETASDLAAQDLYFVALGTGEPKYEELFRSLAVRYPEKFLVKVGYDNSLAHLIEAGSDMFLMPSRYEPSGLNQMYSLKYGTVPIVRATGGLDDAVENFDGVSGTGFKFTQYTGPALLEAIKRALEVYKRKELWSKIVVNGMLKDFSWYNSAREYAELYRTVTARRIPDAEASRRQNPTKA